MKKLQQILSKVILLPLMSAITFGCATGAHFKNDKALGVHQSYWEGRQFLQENQVVNRSEAIAALKANDKTAGYVSSAELLDVGMIVFTGGGSFAFGYGLGTLAQNDGGQPVLIAIGAAGILIGALFYNASGDKYEQAVKTYNADRGFKTSTNSKKLQGEGFAFSPLGLTYRF